MNTAPNVAHRIVRRLRKMLGIVRSGNAEKIFESIYVSNHWGSEDSVSGKGSDYVQTEVIRRVLTKLLSDLEVKVLLDVPCGDFNWMKTVELEGVRYVGGDVVRTIIIQNQSQFGDSNRTFLHIDLLRDELPACDLILCRDCLVHFSFADAHAALKRMVDSDAQYILTTTFPAVTRNQNIDTGEWRPVNLSIYPFNFPEPLQLINENCTEENGRFADKSLGLWSREQLRKALQA